MSKKIPYISAALILFGLVFAVSYYFKTSEVESEKGLAEFSSELNWLGYVGWELVSCADDNRCPPNYDPTSAEGLIPLLKESENQMFEEISRISATSPTLAPLMKAVSECGQYCSCVVWERFLNSSFGKEFQLDLKASGKEGTCEPWEKLSEDQKSEAQQMLNHLESLQN